MASGSNRNERALRRRIKMIKTIEKYFTVEQWDAFLKFQSEKFEIELKQAELTGLVESKDLTVKQLDSAIQAKLEEIALLKVSAVEQKA